MTVDSRDVTTLLKPIEVCPQVVYALEPYPDVGDIVE